MRGSLIAVCAMLVALLCACGGKARTAHGIATIAIDEAMSSGSAQKRTVPWDKLTLTATADFFRRMPDGTPMEGATPGLWAAGSRLKARDAAVQDLSRQLSKLPASEAPPGEAQELNLQQFASRRPELNALLREKLRTGLTEEAQNPDAAKAQLTLTMSLADVAQAVLDQGGGFTPKQAMTNVLGPRARAQANAKSQAEQALLRDLLTRNVNSQMTYAQWVERSPQNRQRVLSALAQAHVIRSQEVETNGKKEWVHEIELDEKALTDSIDEKKVAKKRSGLLNSGSGGEKLQKLSPEEARKHLEGQPLKKQ